MEKLRKTMCALVIVFLAGAFFLVPGVVGADRSMSGTVLTTGSIFQTDNGEEYYINQTQAGNELISQNRGQKVKIQASVQAPEEGMWPTISIKSYEVIQE